MLPGSTSIGGTPVGGALAATFSVASAYDVANADPTRPSLYVLDAFPFDPETGDLAPQHWAQVGSQVEFLDQQYPPRVKEAVSFTASIASGDVAALRGEASSYGELEIIAALNEGDVDDLERYHWDGRAVNVYRGFRGLAFTEWRRVLSARGHYLTSSVREGHKLFLRDPSLELRTPLQSAIYGGTGGLDGTENLKDRRKPITFGPVFNAELMLVDPVYLVYQLHDRAMLAFDQVYDSGIPYISDGDIGTGVTGYGVLASVYDWTPDPGTSIGHYITDLLHGVVRFAQRVEGVPTTDARGHVSPLYGYVDTHAKIVKAMLRDYAGRVDEDLELNSFGLFDLRNPALAHYHDSGSEETTIDVLTKFLAGALAGPTYNALGQLELVQLRRAPPSWTIEEGEFVGDLASEKPPKPMKARTVRGQRVYRVQKRDQLADGVDATHAEFVGEAYRPFRAIAAVPERIAAEETSIDTYFASGELAEAVRQLDLYSGDAKPWTFTVHSRFDEFRVAQSGTLRNRRFRFPTGRSGIILRITEHSRTETTDLTVFC